MESSEAGEQFIHKKDPKLHTTLPVEHEQVRKERAGESVSQRPADKIADWLGVIEKTHMGHKDDTRVLERIKKYYHKEYTIKPEDIPQSYWNLQGEIANNEGRKQDLINAGVLIEETLTRDQNGAEIKKRSYNFPEDLKDQAARVVISNQQQSLDKWINYLTSDDASYPMWAKYWAFRSIVKMGKLEKTADGKARFATREKSTVASFPVLNQRALANTIGAMSARLGERGKPKEEQKPVENMSTTLSHVDFQKLLSTEDFSKLYAQFLAEIPQYTIQGLEETRGIWVKYDQGSDPKQLVQSLEGHPLEWCTADYDTAKTQIEGGDFHVYYSVDEEGKPTVPRLAIRMEGSKIAEPPRGIAPNQNLDPYISDVLTKKLEEFGTEGEAFKKRSENMKRITEIERKQIAREPLTHDDLTFLYEVDIIIEGFGYSKDPRIEEVRNQRNPEEDMPVVFGCDKSQIARHVSEISAGTKAYVGKLESGIFDILSEHQIEHVYTSFPEGKIRRQVVEIGGKTKGQLQAELKQVGVNITSYAEDMLKSSDFTTLSKPQNFDTVRLKVSDLGLSGYPTTDQVYKRAEELGLELCPAEVGPRYRIKYADQPLGEWFYIGMKQITDRRGHPHVFELLRREDGLWLYDSWALPANEWRPEYEFVFVLRKKTQNP